MYTAMIWALSISASTTSEEVIVEVARFSDYAALESYIFADDGVMGLLILRDSVLVSGTDWIVTSVLRSGARDGLANVVVAVDWRQNVWKALVIRDPANAGMARYGFSYVHVDRHGGCLLGVRQRSSDGVHNEASGAKDDQLSYFWDPQNDAVRQQSENWAAPMQVSWAISGTRLRLQKDESGPFRGDGTEVVLIEDPGSGETRKVEVQQDSYGEYWLSGPETTWFSAGSNDRSLIAIRGRQAADARETDVAIDSIDLSRAVARPWKVTWLELNEQFGERVDEVDLPRMVPRVRSIVPLILSGLGKRELWQLDSHTGEIERRSELPLVSITRFPVASPENGVLIIRDEDFPEGRDDVQRTMLREIRLSDGKIVAEVNTIENFGRVAPFAIVGDGKVLLRGTSEIWELDLNRDAAARVVFSLY